MANKDTPRGFWPVRHLTGGTIRLSEYTLASAYSENIYRGDLVKLVTAGGVEVAAAGNRFLGIFEGVSYKNGAGEVIYAKVWAEDTVATEIKVFVYDDPRLVYGVQSAGSTVAADVGELGDHVNTAGSLLTGQSAQELSGTTSTAYAGLRVIGKIDEPGNDWGTNVLLEVLPYEHELGGFSLEATTPGV